jgi:hypothetical protein
MGIQKEFQLVVSMVDPVDLEMAVRLEFSSVFLTAVDSAELSVDWKVYF